VFSEIVTLTMVVREEVTRDSRNSWQHIFLFVNTVNKK
jgi:hypothetical protein